MADRDEADGDEVDDDNESDDVADGINAEGDEITRQRMTWLVDLTKRDFCFYFYFY